MKILYAIQGTGNGYISRANELIPLLEKHGEVDILLSGQETGIPLNHFVKYRRTGLGYVKTKKNTVDFLQTLQQLKSKKFLEEVKSLPVENYDLVINDFEPVSAWACKTRKVPCIAVSHHYAIINKLSPKPVRFDPMAWLVIRYFAPCTVGIGFHFKKYDLPVLTPLIRSEIRHAYTRNSGHYTVYLPAYSDKKLIRLLSGFKKTEWHIFSATATGNYSENNCWIRPVTNYDFISSITSCEGILCSAGFETPAEALYMNKKLMVIPSKRQYEQLCNACALEELGVPVLKNLKKKKRKKIQAWLENKSAIHIPYPDNTEEAIELIFKTAALVEKNKNMALL